MNWVGANLDIIWSKLVAHVMLAVPAILLSFIISIPVAWLGLRIPRLRGVLVAGSSLLYAIPSLPLFIILPLVLGTGVRSAGNVITALTLYGLALMVPSAVEALTSVDRRVISAAEAIGYGTVRSFFTVQLPLAGPTLLAGLRVVSVSTIALVTVAAVLGVDNLGQLFTDGFQRGIMASVVTGIVLTCLLALLFDVALVFAGEVLMPWSRR